MKKIIDKMELFQGYLVHPIPLEFAQGVTTTEILGALQAKVNELINTVNESNEEFAARFEETIRELEQLAGAISVHGLVEMKEGIDANSAALATAAEQIATLLSDMEEAQGIMLEHANEIDVSHSAIVTLQGLCDALTAMLPNSILLGLDRTGTTPIDGNTINSTDEINIPSGVYLVSENTRITSKLKLAKNAIFKVTNGSILTIDSDFSDNGIHQCFDIVSGKVVFTEQTRKVFPEWWGVHKDGTHNDGIAIQAAIDSIRNGVVMLQTGEVNTLGGNGNWTVAKGSSYFISQTLLINKSFITLKSEGLASICFDCDIAIKLNSVGDVCDKTRLENIRFVNVSTDRFSNTPITKCGVHLDGTLRSTIKNVSVWQYGNGFYFSGCSNLTVEDTEVFHGTNQAGKQAIGYYLENHISSGTFNRCVANMTDFDNMNNIGFMIYGNDIRDIFFDRVEVVCGNTGIQIGTPFSNTTLAGDIHINNAVIDMVKDNGILLTDVKGFGLIHIRDGFISNSPTTDCLIKMLNSGGVTIQGTQFQGDLGDCNGIYIDTTCQGINITGGNTFSNCSKGIYTRGENVAITGNMFQLQQLHSGAMNQHIFDCGIYVHGNSTNYRTNSMIANNNFFGHNGLQYAKGIVVSNTSDSKVIGNIVPRGMFTVENGWITADSGNEVVYNIY